MLEDRVSQFVRPVASGARALLAAAGGFLASALEGDALALELLNPRLDAALRLIGLVHLVAHHPDELAVAVRLRARVNVSAVLRDVEPRAREPRAERHGERRPARRDLAEFINVTEGGGLPERPRAGEAAASA